MHQYYVLIICDSVERIYLRVDKKHGLIFIAKLSGVSFIDEVYINRTEQGMRVEPHIALLVEFSIAMDLIFDESVVSIESISVKDFAFIESIFNELIGNWET